MAFALKLSNSCQAGKKFSRLRIKLISRDGRALECQASDSVQLARAAALQSVAVRRSTGNDVVATIFTIIFFSFFPFFPFFFFFSVATFSHREGLGSKNLYSKGCLKWPHYYRFFDLGGLRLVCPPPKGEGKLKVARIKKT